MIHQRHVAPHHRLISTKASPSHLPNLKRLPPHPPDPNPTPPSQGDMIDDATGRQDCEDANEDPTGLMLTLGGSVVGLIICAVGANMLAKKRMVRTHDEQGELLKKVPLHALPTRAYARLRPPAQGGRPAVADHHAPAHARPAPTQHTHDFPSPHTTHTLVHAHMCANPSEQRLPQPPTFTPPVPCLLRIGPEGPKGQGSCEADTTGVADREEIWPAANRGGEGSGGAADDTSPAISAWAGSPAS